MGGKLYSGLDTYSELEITTEEAVTHAGRTVSARGRVPEQIFTAVTSKAELKKLVQHKCPIMGLVFKKQNKNSSLVKIKSKSFRIFNKNPIFILFFFYFLLTYLK